MIKNMLLVYTITLYNTPITRHHFWVIYFRIHTHTTTVRGLNCKQTQIHMKYLFTSCHRNSGQNNIHIASRSFKNVGTSQCLEMTATNKNCVYMESTSG